MPSSTDLNAPGIADRKPRCLGSFIAGYKAAATKRINLLRGTPGAAVWQRNYFEHVIRDEEELQAFREYIAQNPLAWEHDEENPGRVS
jgi:REP element-mobilizing transposase RayT